MIKLWPLGPWIAMSRRCWALLLCAWKMVLETRSQRSVFTHRNPRDASGVSQVVALQSLGCTKLQDTL